MPGSRPQVAAPRPAAVPVVDDLTEPLVYTVDDHVHCGIEQLNVMLQPGDTLVKRGDVALQLAPQRGDALS